MDTKSWFIAFLMMSAFGCINFPHNNKVCPDGSFIASEQECSLFEVEEIDFDPEDFPSVTLDEDKVNYVKSKGLVKGTIPLNQDERGFIGLDFSNSDYESEYWFGFYSIDPTGDSDIPIYKVNNDVYGYNFTAMDRPGHYVIVVSKQSQKKQTLVGRYKLTVLNETDELTAARIAYAFTYWNTIMNTSRIDSWNITEQSINSTDDAYDVYIQAKYDVCDKYSDPDVRGPCIRNNVVFGRYVISKKTGQIIG